MSDLAEDIARAKSMITVPELAEQLGLEVTSQDKITSPWNPDENTPSCHLWETHFWDFSTGQGGDIFDLLRLASSRHRYASMEDLVKDVVEVAHGAGKEPGDVEKQPVRQVMNFSNQLPSSNDQLLFHWEAKLGVRIPRACRVLDGNLLIPHQDAEGVYGVKVRGADGSKSAWPGSQPTKRLYCMDGWKPRDESGVFVVEGETDAWALRTVLPDAWILALPSGASSFKEHWLRDLPKDVTIIFDNDKAGKDARDKWDRATKWTARHVYVPQLANDIRETLGRWRDWRP